MKIVAAQVKKILPHPDSAKLKICIVSDGQKEVQVVCGAQNVRENMLSILAPVGSQTPHGLLISPAKIRGQDSFGMLCSAKELNISSESGVIDLPATIKLGTEFTQIPEEYLSSIPWHTLKKIENFWLDKMSNRIVVQRDFSRPLDQSQFQLISTTYFENGHYRYRQFKVHPANLNK